MHPLAHQFIDLDFLPFFFFAFTTPDQSLHVFTFPNRLSPTLSTLKFLQLRLCQTSAVPAEG